MKEAIIIGGGLAGLFSGIQLARAGISCTIVEKKSYPLHRVCGEYISNETTPFLKKNGLFPAEFSPPQINRVQLSSVTGRDAKMPLDLGGFGISRYAFDHYLFQKAKSDGVSFLLETEVTDVRFSQEKFSVKTSAKELTCDLVIGAFGKRSRLDHALHRSFVKKRSPYAGIKYHIRTDHPHDLIGLHNFKGGYCGISNVEGGKTNLCYLTHRGNLKTYGDISTMEREILFKNPLLKYIFTNSEFLFEKPEVINEISFATKGPVENHILMAGDASGMITPLCGNGMSMAIHASMILSKYALDFFHKKISRSEMEQLYEQEWKKNFSARLWKGRQIQKLFGNALISSLAVNLALYSRPVANLLMRNTHGEAF